MIKNVQLKIIIILTIIGIAIIAGIGGYFLINLQTIYLSIPSVNNIEILQSNLSNVISKGTWILGYALFGFLVIAIGIAIYVITKIALPINRLIDSARKVATGEETKIEEAKKTKEVDGIADAIGMMTM